MIETTLERIATATERIATAFEAFVSNGIVGDPQATFTKNQLNPEEFTSGSVSIVSHGVKEVSDPAPANVAAGIPGGTGPQIMQTSSVMNAGTPEPTFGFYQGLGSDKGLPYLKKLCTERGIEFLAQARMKKIIELLEAHDAENGLQAADTAGAPVQQTMPASSQQAPVVETPFDTTAPAMGTIDVFGTGQPAASPSGLADQGIFDVKVDPTTEAVTTAPAITYDGVRDLLREVLEKVGNPTKVQEIFTQVGIQQFSDVAADDGVSLKKIWDLGHAYLGAK